MLLVSGWTFTEVNYFWSAEFWGGIRCTQIMSRKQRWRRRGFVAVVLIEGSLALLASLATALLMIPISQDWPVGGGIFWLNGSNDQLWPTNLDTGYYAGVNCSDQTVYFLDNRCPAAGFLPLYQHYNTWYKRQNTGYSFELRDSNLRKSMYARPSLISDANTWSFTAHAVTATLQDAMRGLHNDALVYLSATHPQEPPFPGQLMWAELMRFEVKTKVPAVRVLCEPQGMLDLSADNLTMKFPNIAVYDAYWLGRSPPMQRSLFPASKVDLVDILEPAQRHLFARGILHNQKALLSDDIFSQNRSTLIIPVDMKEHSESALGLAIFFGTAWNRTYVDGNLLPSNSVACSVDARWTNAKTVMEMTANTQLEHEYTSGRVKNLVETDLPFSHLIGYYRWNADLKPSVGKMYCSLATEDEVRLLHRRQV
ncbi:hypothetical protein NCS52_01209300 [Fusarium sp. LHS14.1]|nr:hypothetical protein NCS52_01209300 [Fusarium sp. LHS14.1]